LKEEWGAKISDRASLFKPTVATGTLAPLTTRDHD
jgi:hypothetical protein